MQKSGVIHLAFLYCAARVGDGEKVPQLLMKL